MAGSQVSTAVASTLITKFGTGKKRITIDEYDTSAEPEIQAGYVEVGGALYEFTAAESISGWAGISNSTQAYIYIVPSGSSCTAAFSDTAPTFSTSKGGWYNGNNRALWAVYKGSAGTTYENKSALADEELLRCFGDLYIEGDIDVDGSVGIGTNLSVGVDATIADTLNLNGGSGGGLDTTESAIYSQKRMNLTDGLTVSGDQTNITDTLSLGGRFTYSSSSNDLGDVYDDLVSVGLPTFMLVNGGLIIDPSGANTTVILAYVSRSGLPVGSYRLVGATPGSTTPFDLTITTSTSTAVSGAITL